MCCTMEALFSKTSNANNASALHSHIDGEERADHDRSPPVAQIPASEISKVWKDVGGRHHDSLFRHGPILRVLGVVGVP